MIVIDLPADLNVEDDEGRNVARVPDRASHAVGDLVVAGLPGFWSWAVVDEVTDALVFFHRVSATEAAAHGEIAVLAPAV